jgi:acyl carrier protein
MPNVTARIRAIIAEQLGIGEDEIFPDSSLSSDLGADTLDIIEIIMSLEEEYGIEIPDSALGEIETVADLASYIDDKV